MDKTTLHHPTFINVGPGRSGTSWMMEMLLAHPQVAMSSIKETEYFNTNYHRGDNWYLGHFRNSGLAIGEISNMYYVDPDVPARIMDFDPNLKIVFNLREPVELLNSMISFGIRRGIEVSPEILQMPIGKLMGSGYSERAAKGTTTLGDEVTLADSVLLSRYIDAFQKVVPSDQLHFMIYDRVASEPLAALRDLYAFLGVEVDFQPDGTDSVINAAAIPRAEWVGQLATWSASTLRNLGARRLLAALHRAEWIKKALYRTPKEKAESCFTLPNTFADRLADERADLIDRIPVLSKYWTADGAI